jgi:hypothetical protein
MLGHLFPSKPKFETVPLWKFRASSLSLATNPLSRSAFLVNPKWRHLRIPVVAKSLK